MNRIEASDSGGFRTWADPAGKAVLWAPPLLALLTSLAAIGLKFGLQVSSVESSEYLSNAYSILGGRGIPRNYSPMWGFHPPLYSAFIAATWKVVGLHLFAIYVSQAVLFALTAALLAKIAIMVTGRAVLGLLSGVLYAFNPLALNQVNTVEAESLVLFLLVLGVFFLLRAVMETGSHPRPLRDVILAGAVLGLACLCRDVAQAIALVLAVVMWWLLRQRAAPSRWGLPVAMVAAACLVIAPWTILNWRATHEFIPVSTLGGYNLWLGNNPASLRVYEGPFASRAEFNAYQLYVLGLPYRQADAWGNRFYGRGPGGRQQLWTVAAVHEIAHNPGTTAKLWVFKTWALWRPWPNPVAYSQRHLEVLLAAVVEVALYVFALVGLVVLFQQRRPRPFLGLTLGVALATTAVSTISISNVRYRVPTIDPYLYVLGAVGLAAAVTWLVARNRVQAPSREA